jgi:hypothetical protein
MDPVNCSGEFLLLLKMFLSAGFPSLDRLRLAIRQFDTYSKYSRHN